MTCTWPECEKQDCARCVVHRRCFYAGLGQSPLMAFAVAKHGAITNWSKADKRLAQMFGKLSADRLIAWLAWPGYPACHADTPISAGLDNWHPLDATPAAALRGEALVDGAIRWPTVAVILDAIEGAGMWGDVHAWRPTGSWPSHDVDQLKRDVGYAPIYTPSSPMGGV